jgi:hypothetical protein
MLADGLFTRFKKPDFGFALHDGAFAYGSVSYRVGIGSSNSDSLEITFHGRGGHGAAPQRTVDPVMMAARFIVDVQSVISREKDPTEFGVVSIGAIHGGTAENIIPDDVLLRGTIRTFKPEVRARMLAGIERTARAAAAMSDAPAPDEADDRGGETCGGADAERPARAERSATQPTIGAPIGVQPKAIARRIAITRPRIAGSVESCIRLLVELEKGQRRHADDDQRHAEQPGVGRDRGQRAAEPEDRGAEQQQPKCGFSRPAASSAPAMVPTAITDVRSPYWLAPA